MSPPASGPYKSRVLNLILQNYRQFIDSCGSTLRQVQFSTSTTLQTALFSVYSLFNRLVKGKKRLQSTEDPQSLQLDEAQAEQKQLGGVDQPILDLLTIATEEVERSSPLKTDQIAVQAIATQLQTKKLVLVGEDNQVLDVLSWQTRRVLRKYIYRGAVHLSAGQEQHQYSQLQTAFSTAITLAQNSTTAITHTTEELGITLAKAWQTSSKELAVHTPEDHSIQPSVTASLYQVQAVIWAAIDYFFFKDHNHQLNAEFQAENLLSGKPQPQKLTPQPQPQPKKSQRIIYYPIQTNTESTSPATSEKPLKFELTKTQKYDNQISFEAETPANRGDDAAWECLQTEATAVGYVKHPLEQVLEWLDRVLFWLEEAAIKVWEWIRQKWGTR